MHVGVDAAFYSPSEDDGDDSDDDDGTIGPRGTGGYPNAHDDKDCGRQNGTATLNTTNSNKSSASTCCDRRPTQDDVSSLGSDSEDGDGAEASKPSTALAAGYIEAPPADVDLQRRRSSGRRGGMQTSERQLMKGLKSATFNQNQIEDDPAILKFKKRFEAMDILVEDSNDLRDGTSGMEDIDFIRVLPPALFATFVMRRGLPVERYGIGKAKLIRDLWAEVVMRESTLEQIGMPDGYALQRRVRIVFLQIRANIEGEDRFLLLKNVTCRGSQRLNLNMRPNKKMFPDEESAAATWRCLYQILGLQETPGKKLFEIESTEDRDEVKESEGYPGLLTYYRLHVVHMRVVDILAPELASLGLPEGDNFKIEAGASGVFASARNCNWSWCSRERFEEALAGTRGEDPTSP
eukprot:gnl/TRDRNA2_/TRDRNA2_200751_c0_seq1.p1 gnl/TRDRNA2_/TRDRNA2_200751_c0~~gnl/TRDRNA2_/TRDRNA2_200751_c0_seq1.p1  ORF type:complete len:407 (+),score=76.17 gnl/TRDRNA2_/TRDRNA2_200751_c0_seq1:60-1280(+)